MTPLEIATVSVVGVVAALAAAFDVRERRIPNWLTVGGLAAGLALGGLGGWAGLGWAAAGAVVAFALGLPLFLLGGLGGGDVKLLAAVGALVGLQRLPTALLVTALVGGVLAALAVIRRGAVKRTVKNLGTILVLLVTSGGEMMRAWKGEGPGAALTVDAPEAVTVPYGVAIAAGGLAAVLL